MKILLWIAIIATFPLWGAVAFIVLCLLAYCDRKIDYCTGPLERWWE